MSCLPLSSRQAGTLVTHGHNSEECTEAGSLWDLSMIVRPSGGTFLSLSMSVALPGPSLWLWRFLGLLNDWDILSGLFMIVTLPRASQWFWHFLELLNDNDTSWDVLMIVTLNMASLCLWHFLRGLYDYGTYWVFFKIVVENLRILLITVKVDIFNV